MCCGDWFNCGGWIVLWLLVRYGKGESSDLSPQETHTHTSDGGINISMPCPGVFSSRS